VLKGYYQEEKRFLLHCILEHNNEVITESVALNDVVVSPGKLSHMIEFETYINEEFVCSQRADGLIISSPTGSTAYALSGGGPILHPELNAIVLVPMFPHTLSSRPIVVDAKSLIEIHLGSDNETCPHLSSDGEKSIAIPPGSKIKINKHTQQLSLIHPKDYNYYKTLREKLHWERSSIREELC